MNRFKKAIAAAALYAAMFTPSLSAVNPCPDENCGQQEMPKTPSAPPAPDVPPAPSTQPVDIYPALVMNFESIPYNQIHLEGWWDCGTADPAKNPEDAIFCPNKPAPKTRGMWHKYVVMDRGPRRPDCDVELVFTKSRWGGGMETQCVHPDRITFNEEELSWNRVEKYRTLQDDLGRPGHVWTRRGVPAGEVHAEQGMQQFRTCADISAVVEEYAVHNAWSLYGPYDISTPEGLAAAERDLAPYTPPGYPVVEPAWRTYNTKVPNGKASNHVFLVMRTDSWALKPGYDPAKHPGGLANLDAWSYTESHYYLRTGPTYDETERGFGLPGWRLRRNELDGTYTYILQVISDTVVLESPGEIQYGTCKNVSTVEGADIMSSEEGSVRAENRAARPYNWGDLPLDGISPQEWRRLKRLYRHYE